MTDETKQTFQDFLATHAVSEITPALANRLKTAIADVLTPTPTPTTSAAPAKGKEK
jgi:hypothetical protein